MFSAAVHLLPIKDLKDLRVFFGVGGAIDMQDLKDLKRYFSRVRSRGTDPRGTVCKAVSFHRRARACASPCLGLNGKRPWTAGGFRAGRAIAGDRPPRYGPGRVLLKVCKTLMSIVRAGRQVRKVL